MLPKHTCICNICVRNEVKGSDEKPKKAQQVLNL